MSKSKSIEVNEKTMEALLLSGYVSDSCCKKTFKETEYEITTFQGDHKNEYMVKEVNTGRCQLFCKGIITLAWMVNKSKKVGGYTVYERGKAIRTESWDGMTHRKNCRYLEKDGNTLSMVIRAGEDSRIVYRGEFDDPYSMKREGRGVEYDAKSGRILMHGVWKNDELFQIHQEFTNERVMIEYEVMDGEENVSVLNRHPKYEGGYVFDEEKREFVRDGKGCLLNINTGMSELEGEWQKGCLRSSTVLYNGWTEQGMMASFRQVVVKDIVITTATVSSVTDWKTLDDSVMKLVITSNCCNESELKVFDVSKLTNLRSIEIGDDCFENVNEVKMIGMKKLERVVIGKNCFTKKKNSSGNDPNRHFHLKNCEAIKELKMGCYSFSDYTVCKIANVNSLEVIEMGDLNESSNNFYSANCKLENLPQLKSCSFGNSAFSQCTTVAFSNLAALISIQLGNNAMSFDSNTQYNNSLVLSNLPKLTTLRCSDSNSRSFYYAYSVTLYDMPALTSVCLPNRFYNSNIKNKRNIGALANYM